MKIERRSRNSVVAKLQVLVTSCCLVTSVKQKRTSLSQRLESYQLDEFDTDANVVGLTFQILFPVLKIKQSEVSPMILSERYAASLDWVQSSLEIGQIVHVPFEDGVVYEGTYDPDNGTTTSVFTPWECVRVRWKNDDATTILLPTMNTAL